MEKKVVMTINGKKEIFQIGHEGARWQVPDEETLLTTLRERLDLTGSKEACGQGACGCCTVVMNGEAVPSCQVLTANCDGADIVTIEGLQNPATGELDMIQKMVVEKYAFQCGYCTPGIIMTLEALFHKNQTPTTEEIKEALAGNLCRCISQYHVITAAEEISRKNAEKGGEV